MTLSAGKLEVEISESPNGGWTKVSEAPQLVGNRYVLSLAQPSTSQQYYRLHKP